jgi:diacylglycerol kinase family enzyme
VRALVLINDSPATILKIGAAGDPAAHIRAVLDKNGMTADVRRVEPARVTDEARRAVPSDALDAVIAGGGDGTVNAVASALVGSPVALGVLPLGTRNHFARSLGMPLTLAEACAALARSTVLTIDAGEVNGNVFVNNASVGLYPLVVGEREELRRRRFTSKWVAMLFAIASVMRRFPTLRVRIVTDHQTIYRDTPFVFVGNNHYESQLFAVGERRRLDAGELGVYFTTRVGRFGLARLALRTLLGRLEQARDFEAMSLKQCWLETGRRAVYVAMDGELRRMTPPLHFRSRPGELRVLAPTDRRAGNQASQVAIPANARH